MSMPNTRDYLLSQHHLPTNSTVPPYSEGVSLWSEENPVLSEYSWPTHAAVPWPEGTFRGRYFRIGVFEDDVEVPSHEVDAQTWDMHRVDARWSHLHFIWKKGKTYTARGVLRSKPVPLPAHPIVVAESAGNISIETGRIKALINKTQFALFDEIRFSSNGDGVYDKQILSGSLGPEILDNGTTFAARFDSTAKVTVEIQSPLYVVVKAEGVYKDPAGISGDWAMFTTRIHFWADQEWIRVVHNLGYVEDMAVHEYDRAVLLMPFNFAERFAFAADDSGAAHKGDFSDFGGADVYLHQDRHNSYRFGRDTDLAAETPFATGERSRNCWAVQGWTAGVRVECYLRNGWQEFPFEVRLGPTVMGLSMQPWHGYEAFGPLTSNAHTGMEHIHKLRFAHSGQRQRQGLPGEYVNAFNTMDPAHQETFETTADDAGAANWQGMMLRQDFYLRIATDGVASSVAFDTSNLVAYATLVQHRPIAIPDPSHVQESFVFGPIGTISDGYGEVFEYATDIMKGDHNPDRGEYYGRFRWGALPHKWDVTLNRPSWHRLEYGDSHYDRIAIIFWYYLATGDTELLQVARKAVKFHQCFRFVNYGPATPIDHHGLMLQWHKGLTPGAAYAESVASSGHSVHAYSMLVGWLVDADLDLKDVYQRWSEQVIHFTNGRDRNINNNLHEAIQQFEFFRDRAMKAPIKAMTASLISEPMITPVQSSRDWDAAWPLYLNLHGGSGVRQFFQAEATPGHWLYEQSGNGAHMALCYLLTNDVSFLERVLKPLRSMALRQIFRADSGRYSPGFSNDIYSQPELHKTLLHFLYYLKKVGITEIPEDDDEPGQYPLGSASFNSEGSVKDRGIWIPIHNPDGNPFTLQIRIATVGGGSLDTTGVFLYDPTGTELLHTLDPEATRYDEGDGLNHVRQSGWSEFLREVNIPAGPAGRYDLYMGSHEAGQFLPTTAEGLLECGVIRNTREYHASVTRMYILPKTTAYEIQWTFRPWNNFDGCRIRIHDANHVLLTDTYLMKNEPGHESITLRMNGAGDPPTPWRIDCGITYAVEAASVDALNDGVQNLALIGPSVSDLQAMEPLIPLA